VDARSISLLTSAATIVDTKCGLSPSFPTGPARRSGSSPPAVGMLERRRRGHWPVWEVAPQRREVNPSRLQRLSEGGPERIQMPGIPPLATRAGVDTAIPLRKMHEQFRPLIQADHDGHKDGCVLAKPIGFRQQKLLELLDDRFGFHRRRRWRPPRFRRVGRVDRSLHRPVPGLAGRSEAAGFRRSRRGLTISFPDWETRVIAVRQCFHANPR